MSRRFPLLPSISAVALLIVSSLARAAAPVEIDNAKHQYLGQINANAVHVRSGPSDNDYPVMRLSKGAQVTVVGIKFEWLKIAPPDGCFSYVSKLYVERFGDGSVGKVTKDNLNVWCGSSMMNVKSALQCRLSKGADVQILGEADEYYKIKPPADAFVWVHQGMVTPVQKKPDLASNTGGNSNNNGGNANTGGNTNSGGSSNGGIARTETPTTREAGSGNIAANNPPATQPTNEAAMAAATEFDKLDEQYKANEAKPIEEQTAAAELAAAYEKLVGNDALPSSMRVIAQGRAADLKGRKETQAKLAAAKKEREDREKRMLAMKTEQEELAAKAKELSQTAFAGVGTLSASSLQFGGQTLYRLTDPANGRTLVYVRSADAKFAAFMGQFAGVKGTVATESTLNLRVITATEIMAVDQAKVGNGITAQFVPPSLLAKSETARTE